MQQQGVQQPRQQWLWFVAFYLLGVAALAALASLLKWAVSFL
ncbi:MULTISPECIES: hypothetical protein [Rheinheimera]|uniref:DUF2474 domain-containing protein n=1 Tax=Rheinheimera marina TaxID=1774958 RepID=A0ABV9JIH2_9GAMM